jgi:hypothetical protein
LGVRPPSFLPCQPDQAATALSALAALYRDYLEHGLDSPREKSVDVDAHAADPPLHERRFE